MKTTPEQRAELRWWLSNPDHGISNKRTRELLDDLATALTERDRWGDYVAGLECEEYELVECDDENCEFFRVIHKHKHRRYCGTCPPCLARAEKAKESQ